MIKSLVVLLLFALVLDAFLTFILFVVDVLKWHDKEKREKIIPSATDQSAEPVESEVSVNEPNAGEHNTPAFFDSWSQS
jgi:hypothetical protein